MTKNTSDRTSPPHDCERETGMAAVYALGCFVVVVVMLLGICFA